MITSSSALAIGRTFRGAAVVALLAAIGCGEAPSANAPEGGALDQLSVHTSGGRLVSARVTPESVVGHDVSFGRYFEADGRFLRGTAFGKPIYLTLEPDRAVGVFGTQPFDLRVEPSGRGLHFSGVVAGKPSSFWLEPRRLHGSVGACGYELTADGAAYLGTSGCLASPQMTSVEVPATLTRWSPPELGAALGIFLSNASG